ncbi:MAG: 4-(cytidine 5'-diphospho)-2-C-methyl-D-erythritol kinase [Ruminococcaceae bacterium]|nr:4-(cytidine 5'-diphospho)-2-C-methyl-D-erythritol kinase [Oscillospiraceae bacterium]
MTVQNIAQLLGYGGLLCSVLSFQFNEGKIFLNFQMAMKLFFFANLLLLGGIGGALLNVVGFFNNLIVRLREDGKAFAAKKCWTCVFVTLFAITGVSITVITRDARQLLPTVGAVCGAIMISFKSVTVYRLVQLLGVSPCWLIYHKLFNSCGGVISEIIGITSIIVALTYNAIKKPSVSLLSAAKVNLVLSVPELRDDGYHEISTVMQTIDLCDRITISPARDIRVESDTAPCGEDNICYKAAEFFSNYGGAHIKIEKKIPMLSGLGGGSSDAAGVLLALNKMYDEPFSEQELVEKAMLLGSDVPFFIKGGTALIEGKGENVVPCEEYESYLVLIKHGKKLSTGKMYSELDKCGLKDRREEVYSFCDSLKEKSPRRFFNDFESVFDCKAEKEALRICGATDACLSGSGPTVFGSFPSAEAAEKCAEKLRKGYDEVYCCKTVSSGIIFE